MATKTALITGTSTGIGAACVKRQAAAGWRVYAGVRKPEDGERLAAATDGEVIPVILDVTDAGHVDAILARIDGEVGSLDGLVNNAGIALGGPVELLTDADWRQVFDVNFFSVVALTRASMDLVSRGDGRFVHIGSLNGRVSAPGLGPYASTKHALEAFNWSLRGELMRTTKMTSSLVEPGQITTDIWDKATDLVAEFDSRLEGEARDRYDFLLDANLGFIEEARTGATPADEVAKAVEHALTAKRPKARYLVGVDAKAGAAFARLLPDRIYEAVMTANLKRMESKGRPLRG